MKLIMRYLKPFALTLVISITFLFVQALCELQLPNLMSDMVNKGIQAGGVEQGAPEAISEQGMKLLQLYMNEQDAAAMSAGYNLVKAGSAEAADAAEEYPSAREKDIYVRVDQSASAGERTDALYTKAVSALALSLQSMQGGQDAQNSGSSDLPGSSDSSQIAPEIKMEELYPLLPLLGEMKAAGALDAHIAAADAEESLAGAQIAVTFTRAFYSELGVELGDLQSSYIIRKGIQMGAVTLLSVLAAIAVGWFAAKIGTTVAARMRRDVFEKVGQFSNAEYDKFSTASLITRTTNDIQQIQQLVMMSIRMIFYAPIIGIGGIILAVNSSLSMSWIIAVAVVSIIGLILTVFALALPKFKILQQLIDKLNLVSRENLSGMMVIRAFGNERFEEQRFERANDNLRLTNRFVQRIMAFMFPAMMLIMNLITLLIVWVGARSIAASELQIGSMIAFMQYAMIIIMSFLMISIVFIMVPRAFASAARIQEVLDTELTIRDSGQVKPISSGRGMIEFKDVSFRYHNAEEDVLKHISFTARPGETTAFIGTTGAGKSTLINLIPRFYDVTEGQITFDGTDIRELSQQELRSRIGYVPQKGILFSGDIASNVRYGRDSADEAEIREALEIAQATSFVDRMEDGMQTAISQGGTNVSGGQRQRLSIARALIKKAPVYIFDDSFSALDLKTDAALRKALKRYTSDAAVLIVAQRVSTIMNAEQIIVLDKGQIVGRGTHQELLDSCSEYREIAESQLSKEELA
ncbi:ABC transporter ATP-binding protein [Paenibacillus sambharensis]|uniref:ABC transporter ATP-binding protein n=1 Tax=Paenibacillus sambharensis TaxID=1803190 RepID=A0A2W1LIY1_9BACL|nr:ABC transporter ATP-binding protein [Paenibacillus sambharensis]PZD95032.1 ABC transporter ATP-binding protein [Paenibacillus sambharensis]